MNLVRTADPASLNIDVAAVLNLAATLVVVLAGVTAGVVWLRRWLRKQVAEPLSTVENQVTRNGGSSMHDAVDRTAASVEANTAAVQMLTQRFDDHLRWAHGGAWPHGAGGGGRDG